MTSALTSDFAVCLLGSIGGLTAEFMHWYSLRHQNRLPVYLKSPFYWMITIGMVLVGGLVAWLRYGASGTSFDVFVTGLTAPILLQKIINQAPRQKTGAKGDSGNLYEFFVW